MATTLDVHCELLAAWRRQKPRRVALADILAPLAMQSRCTNAVPFMKRDGVAQESTSHVHRLANRLEADDTQMEAVLLAQLPSGELRLVDGFHRWKAHHKARRTHINARVQSMSERTAAVLSKMVNVGGESLAMHPNQTREVAWQFLVMTTRECRPSIRKIVAAFGCAKSSVEKMFKALDAGISADGYSTSELDPASGMPTWKARCDKLRPSLDEEDAALAAGSIPTRLVKLAERINDAAERFAQLSAKERRLVLRVLRSDSRGGDELLRTYAEATEAAAEVDGEAYEFA